MDGTQSILLAAHMAMKGRPWPSLGSFPPYYTQLHQGPPPSRWDSYSSSSQQTEKDGQIGAGK